MGAIKEWFLGKMNEFILFLEYPVDYIVEFGDDLKERSTGGKIAKIAKIIISIYICILIFYVLFVVAVILIVLFGGGTGSGSERSLAENLYADALRAKRDDAVSAAESGRGSWADVADIEQEMKNNGI